MKILSRIYALLITVIVILSCNQASSETDADLQKQIEKPAPNSMFLNIRLIDNMSITGTGCIVTYKNQEYFITNWHNLTGREVTGVIRNARPDTLVFWSTTKGLFDRIRIPANDSWLEYRDSSNKLFDMVALPFNGTVRFNINKNPIDNLNNYTGNEDSCLIFGFPKSYIDYPRFPKYLYTTPKQMLTKTTKQKMLDELASTTEGTFIIWNEVIEDGTSGSPVYSTDMKLLGIYSTKYQMGNLNRSYGYFWNISAIKKLLEFGKPVDWTRFK